MTLLEDSINGPVKYAEDILFTRYRENPSVENRNLIVTRYIYLAEIISRKFINRGIDYDDLYQVACIALINAVNRFEPSKGVKFASFATPTVIGELKRHFRDKGSLIRVPRRIYEVYKKVNHAKEHLTQTLQRVPRVDEIAAHINMSEESVLEILESGNTYNMQSFDQSIYADDDVELYETIGADDITFTRIENRDFLERSFERFNVAEKEFIVERFIRKKTQKEIARSMGVSQMFISRLEKKVLDRFRLILEKS